MTNLSGEIKRILAFGDSITFGSKDRVVGGWVVRLKNYFAQTGQFCHVFNLGISGENTTQIIQRMEGEIKPRISSKPGKKSLLIIGISTNDTCMKGSLDAEPELSEEEFRSNLEKLREIGNKQADALVFLGITRVDEKKTDPWQEVVDRNIVCWRNDVIKRYNKIAKDYCAEKGIPFIDLFDLLSDSDLPDGLHPNASGHEKMFLSIKDFLIRKGYMKEIEA